MDGRKRRGVGRVMVGRLGGCEQLDCFVFLEQAPQQVETIKKKKRTNQ